LQCINDGAETTNEVLVLCFRRFGKIYKKQTIMSTLTRLKADGFVINSSHGKWSAVKRDEVAK
jgi:hypothetical protein